MFDFVLLHISDVITQTSFLTPKLHNIVLSFTLIRATSKLVWVFTVLQQEAVIMLTAV